MRADMQWMGILIGLAISGSVALLIFMLTCVAVIFYQGSSIGFGDWAGWANAFFTLLAFGAAGLAVFYSHRTYESQQLTSDREHMDGAFTRLADDANSLPTPPSYTRKLREINNDPDSYNWMDEDEDYSSSWLDRYLKMAMAIDRMLVVATNQHPKVRDYAATLITTYLDPNVLVEIYACAILDDGWRNYGNHLKAIYDGRAEPHERTEDMIIVNRDSLICWYYLWRCMSEMSFFLQGKLSGALMPNYPENIFSGSEALKWLHSELLRLDKIRDSMYP